MPGSNPPPLLHCYLSRSLLLSPAMCGREHPVLVHEDTRALELEVMEEGDLPGMRVTCAQGAGGLEV